MEQIPPTEEEPVDVYVDLSRSLRLDALLKIIGVAPTGGVAKIMIQSGDVYLNGVQEQSRGRKLADRDVVRVRGGGSYRVLDES